MQKRGDRYFDGYERVAVRDEQGNLRHELQYTGPWYGYQESGLQKELKIKTGLLTLTMLISYFYAQLNPGVGGMIRYMAIPSLLALVPMIFSLMGQVNFLFAKGKWELRVFYAGYQRLRRAGICLLVLLGAWTLMELVFICLNPGLLGMELVYVLCAGAATAAEALLLVLLYRNEPRVVEGPTIR